MHRCRCDPTRALTVAITAAVLAPIATIAQPRKDRTLEEVVVLAPYGVGISRDRVPASVQTATAEDIERAHTLDLTDFLNRSFGSINISHSQNNPLQPDVNFRGFTASPLLGLSPGMTVYQSGVRINEPFGDTVSWDLVPLSAVSTVQLLAGTNPVFGLNTLGGALSLEMKDGFEHEGSRGEIYGGSFARRSAVLEHGANDGRWGFYGSLDYFEEQGWRDYSDSDALRFFGVISMRGADSTLDLSVAYADTELRGNGAAPVELLALDREQVFTHPDLTENTLRQVIMEGAHNVSDSLQLAGNAFYREIDTDSFNGDGTIFERCDIGGDEFLVEDEFTDLNDDEECSSADDAGIEVVLDLNGNPIEAGRDDEALDAVNNVGRRSQEIYGASLQLGWRTGAVGGDNNLTLGVAISQGRTSFASNVEVARLLDNRSTSRTGIFVGELVTGVESEIDVASVYFADTLDLTDSVALMIAGRYDSTRIELADRTGESPELNGSHKYERFNPAAGLTFRLTPQVSLFASYSQSARAPTPVELACASQDAPCNLPNAFLADPPLDQVVANSIELGVRGMAAGLQWHAGVFRTTNEDDILFQTTGGAQANVGFFDNVGDTRRQGLELRVSQRLTRLHWYAEYSWIDATFDDTFIVNSPNHPIFEDDPLSPAIVGDGKLQVRSGNAITGIPQHQGNAGVDVALNDRLRLGADIVYRSGIHLRGDEVNLLDRTDDYAVLNLRGEYQVGDHATLFLVVENVLHENYETFGLLGEPDEVFEDFEDPRFLGAGPPFGAWLGIRVRL